MYQIPSQKQGPMFEDQSSQQVHLQINKEMQYIRSGSTNGWITLLALTHHEHSTNLTGVQPEEANQFTS